MIISLIMCVISDKVNAGNGLFLPDSASLFTVFVTAGGESCVSLLIHTNCPVIHI